MSETTAGVVFIAAMLAALALSYKPLGDYMYRVVTREHHRKVERGIYRVIGARPGTEQNWAGYARSVLAFSVVSILVLFLFQRVQSALPFSNGFIGVEPGLAWNTAVSFTTNTNWQAYSGEATMGIFVQASGLAVQNFVSAAVGIAVAIVLVRGFARKATDKLGNFWVDLTRIVLWVLLPISLVAAIVLIGGGVVQNLTDFTSASTTTGDQTITGGLIASQEAIKNLGTNGGGPFNANAAHPFENPTSWTNFVIIYLLLVIPFSLPRTFGRLVGQNRQGYAIAAVMGVIALASVSLVVGFENMANGTVPQAVSAAMEGKEVRFGIPDSGLFAAATTLTSTGSVNSFHDSYTSFGGGVLMLDMMLGEVAPGGVGAGLYGMLVLATITVFIAGLMVGRTPEYLGKKIGAREIKLASLYFLVTPALLLIGVAASIAVPENLESMQDAGPHGLSEMLYAFASASNNNGSAFAGFGANTPWFNTALGLCMLFGRFLPIILVLALAGSLAKQKPVPATAGTFPTHKPLFVGMVVGVTIILVALTFLPVLALGPIADGLQ
ncbi:potassium-transporting ATPase subunit KdpA [Glycomyces algeriensis]|uniref:Potassium-transporting ATPase potassium-binding subunit n=1 Tax=Glycomyces algeriensis TaxID=256037 RepID=A0A9W6GA52_9ACTN|nr:potassium-transporting ATPase subunit KdpA [Glycomyces algeriensis]MDA1364315.1 potassium-transporting ATPase subunit KdpA [Glycomyces algeriensis]MDR7350348.1 K+-transporting ATPase ATPase A chain [Glycomyces algeriensis]GLI43053.1 potassium-transporting ATPase potassium-binding subunit [Glycomyces algeriensis]